jgi:PAS domain S-box-containing protein
VTALVGAAITALLLGVGAGWWARHFRAAESPRRSEDQFALAIAGSNAGIFDWDLASDRVFLSRRAQELIGLEVSDARRSRREWLALIRNHPDDTARLRDSIRAHIAGQTPAYDVESRVMLPGGPRWFRQRGIALRDASGKAIRMAGSIEDIGDRKAAEEELALRRQELQRLTESIADYLWSVEVGTDGTLSYRYFSPVVERITGRPPAYYVTDVQDRWFATIEPRDRAPVSDALRRILSAEADRVDTQYRIVRPDGTVRCLRDSMHATPLDDGRMLLDGVASDITEHKLASEALRESEARFRSLTELSSDWYWRQDETLTFNYLSSQAIDLTGYTGESSYGKKRWELLNMWPLSGSWDEHKATLAARQPFRDFECYRVGPDGTVRYLSMTGEPIFDAQGRFAGYHGIGRNITERKRIEEELRARQDMLDLAQKAAHAAAFEWHMGSSKGPARWSPELAAMLGLAPGAYDGTFDGWRKLVSSADLPVVDKAIAHPDENGDVAFEYRVTHVDGTLRWLQLKGRVSFDHGEPARLVGFMLDVTERHLAEEELRRLERQLRQAQRLEAMGTLAGGIAHDFNNILGAILGYGERALRDATAGSRLQRDLDSIMTAGERGRSLVEQILTFSRNSANELILVHVERVVHEALDHLAAKLPQSVVFEPILRGGPAAVRGNPTQVHQIVMNLVTNAVHAMPAGGTLRLLLEPARLSTQRIMTTGTVEPGDYVVLEVSDSGTGISPDIVDRIFDPFFTTKEVGIGTGLGLSLVHGIVAELGGAINVVSEAGTGSTFTVYLPRAGEATESDHGAAPDVPRGSGERVLVVDDEAPLMLIATETLQDYGYEAVGFTSSQAALAAFCDDPLAFDAIVTDERMPGMTGTALLRELRNRRATFPSILMSGYIGGPANAAEREVVPDEVLKKPLSGRDLAACVARVLQKFRTPEG